MTDLQRVVPTPFRRIMGLAFMVVCFAPPAASAWGNEGHRIICQIALERLTPAGKALVSRHRRRPSAGRRPVRRLPGVSGHSPG